jgi:hypothetical protein
LTFNIPFNPSVKLSGHVDVSKLLMLMFHDNMDA